MGRSIKTRVPPTKQRAMRMKQMRSKTVAANTQSFIARSVCSFWRRCRYLVRTTVANRSRMFNSTRSVPLTTCTAPSPSGSSDTFGRWLLPPFNAESSSIASTSTVFWLSPAFDEHGQFMQTKVAMYWHTSFLNCSHDKRLLRWLS